MSTPLRSNPTHRSAWFAVLENAHKDNDEAAAARATHELEKLGVHLEFRIGPRRVVVGKPRTTANLPQLVRAVEIGRALGISANKVKALAEAGELPSVILPDGQIRYDIGEVRSVLSFSSDVESGSRRVVTLTNAAKACNIASSALRGLAESSQVPSIHTTTAEGKRTYLFDVDVLRDALLRRSAEGGANG